MPITLQGAKVLKKLDTMDIRILQMIETLLKEGEYAPVDKIATYSGYPAKEVKFRLSKIHKLNLIERWKGHYVGYTLRYGGHDALALNALYEQEIVSSIGSTMAVGKESDVYYALDFDNNEILLKINRTGRTSFKEIKRKRDLVDDRYHFNMFFLATLSAQKEYEFLSKLQNTKLPIPEVYGNNRHIIAMEIIDGIELVNVPSLKKPLKLLKKIIKTTRKLFRKYKIVHGDLTEFNILYNPDKRKIALIDFPQAVDSDHPEAKNILERDLSHLLDFFSKKHGVTLEVNSVLEYIIK